MKHEIYYATFTKRWKEESIEELAQKVGDLGFEYIDYPLRDGYQIEPQKAETDLKKLADGLSSNGVEIACITSAELDEYVFAGCAEAEIPYIRIMATIDEKLGYKKSEEYWVRLLSEKAALCEKYSVEIAIQPHYGPLFNSAVAVGQILDKVDSKYIGAVWDAAHSGLAGEIPEYALEILWDRLKWVNFKNAYYKRSNEPEADEAKWVVYVTTALNGYTSWEKAIKYLKSRDYNGIVNLTNEYRDAENAVKYLSQDLEYAQKLFDEGGYTNE